MFIHDYVYVLIHINKYTPLYDKDFRLDIDKNSLLTYIYTHMCICMYLYTYMYNYMFIHDYVYVLIQIKHLYMTKNFGWELIKTHK
jgi:hypothetical protein